MNNRATAWRKKLNVLVYILIIGFNEKISSENVFSTYRHMKSRKKDIIPKQSPQIGEKRNGNRKIKK